MSKEDEIKKFADMIGEEPRDQARNQLRILDGLFARAVAEKDWSAALKIQAEAAALLKRTR